MNNKKRWIITKIRMGWVFMTAGVFVVGTGVYAEIQFAYLPYNMRIITGLGILLLGIGIGYLVRYKTALKNEQSTIRVTAEEKDERTMLIRARAGNKAYWVSAAIFYIGLMWASFASNGSLPELTGDAIWYFFSAGVLIPFGVYVVSDLIDQRNL